MCVQACTMRRSKKSGGGKRRRRKETSEPKAALAQADEKEDFAIPVRSCRVDAGMPAQLTLVCRAREPRPSVGAGDTKHCAR